MTSATPEFFKLNFPAICKFNSCTVPDLTGATLFGREPSEFQGPVQQSRLLLDFDNVGLKPTSHSYLPVSTSKPSSFNWNEYKPLLKTRHLGQTVIHVEVINSTFDVLDGHKDLKHGIAVIADVQTNGRGRGQNVWISPQGCAMTSFQLSYSLKSPQGQKATLLQHLVSLAVVHSLKDMVELKLKWPNDIYYGAKVKMGGVVAYSSICNDKMTFNVGFGFNLANSEPTICLNDLLKNEGLPMMSREAFFASVFNTLEGFLDMLSTTNGLAKILQLYHDCWLHSNQEVSVVDESGEPFKAMVKSIDEDGFLRVQLARDGQIHTVHPGNNSFDMMQGLILPKKQ